MRLHKHVGIALVLAWQGVMAQQPTAQSAAADSVGLEEVVVTATRRAEPAQTTALAIAVVGSDQLKEIGATQAADLQALIPGLTVSEAGATTNIFVRGVGSFATDATAESAIATSINGVYISRPNGIGPIFYDLDRVEVLKGPQGTLYGKNASGGALNIITTQPGPDLDGYATLTYGNYDLRQATAALNLPAGDTLSFRLATQDTDRNGYLTDGYDDLLSQAARAEALWKPVDTFSLLFTGEYTHQGGKGGDAVPRSDLYPNPANPWTGPSVASLQPVTVYLGGTPILPNGFTDVDVYAASFQADWNLGWATLTFIPAYRHTQPRYLTYDPGFYFDTGETSGQQSDELRLSHADNQLKWVVGGYYFTENQTELYNLFADPIQQNRVDDALHTRSYAAFGEATYTLVPGFRLTAGLRYSKDEKSQDGQTLTFAPVGVNAPMTGATSDYGQRDFSNTSWKAGAEYDLASDSMLYFTAATGYKAGGFFPGIPYPDNSFKPETLTAYTLGSKNLFLDRRVQVNLETFYWDYKNKQEHFLGATQSGSLGLLTTNAGKATLYGAELDVQLKPTNTDLVRSTFQYLHTRYDQFQYLVYNPALPGLPIDIYSADATGCTLGRPVPFVPAGATQQTIDCSGKPLVRAPTWSGTFSYQHTFALGVWELIPGATAAGATRQYLTADFINSGQSPGYVRLDADVTFRPASGRWYLQGWMRNATDKAVYTGGYRYPFSLPAFVPVIGDPSLFYADIQPPRTYGVTVNVKF